MALRENQPTVLDRANEPSMGNSIADRPRDATGEVPAQQLGAICNQQFDCGVSLRACYPR